MRACLIAVTFLLLAPGCFNAHAFNQEARAKVARRAAFDLSCPEQNLELVELDYTEFGSWEGTIATIGVRGCSLQATYVRVPNFNRWLLDGAKEPIKAH